MLALVAAHWRAGLVGVAIFAALLIGENHGAGRIQQKWDAERVTIAQALTDNANAQRAKEFADQQNMNKVQADATQRLEALRTDADSANAAADRLREQVGKLLASNPVCASTGTGTSRTTASNPGNLLAIVLDKSVERNKQLAAFADAAITAAQSCQTAYSTSK